MTKGKNLRPPQAVPRQYKINAKYNDPGYSFELTDMSGNPADLVFNKSTTNGMHRRDYYALAFHLHNGPNCDLQFVSDKQQVLSACSEQDAVNNCAPQGSSFFPIFYVDPNMPLTNNLVHVINTDPDVEKFYFGFSFVSRSSGEPVYYDPGGENQNGGLQKFDWSAALAGAVSGSVAAIGAASLIGSLEPSSALLYGAGGAVVGLIVGLVIGRF